MYDPGYNPNAAIGGGQAPAQGYDPNATVAGSYPAPAPSFQVPGYPALPPGMSLPQAPSNANMSTPYGAVYSPPPAGYNPTAPSAGGGYNPAAPAAAAPAAPSGGGYYNQHGPVKDYDVMGQDVLDAYKNLWGDKPTQDYLDIHRQVAQMFANYNNRMPRVGDWERIWRANRLANERQGVEGNPTWTEAGQYDPIISRLAPGPQIQPPSGAYEPSLSF